MRVLISPDLWIFPEFRNYVFDDTNFHALTLHYEQVIWKALSPTGSLNSSNISVMIISNNIFRNSFIDFYFPKIEDNFLGKFLGSLQKFSQISFQDCSEVPYWKSYWIFLKYAKNSLRYTFIPPRILHRDFLTNFLKKWISRDFPKKSSKENPEEVVEKENILGRSLKVFRYRV